MTTKAAKAAAAAAAAGDVKKPDELTPENTVDGVLTFVRTKLKRHYRRP